MLKNFIIEAYEFPKIFRLKSASETCKELKCDFYKAPSVQFCITDNNDWVISSSKEKGRK